MALGAMLKIDGTIAAQNDYGQSTCCLNIPHKYMLRSHLRAATGQNEGLLKSQIEAIAHVGIRSMEDIVSKTNQRCRSLGGSGTRPIMARLGKQRSCKGMP